MAGIIHHTPLNDPALLEIERSRTEFVALIRAHSERCFDAAGHGRGADESAEDFERRLRITMLINSWCTVTGAVLESTGRQIPADDLSTAFREFFERQTAALNDAPAGRAS